MYWSIILPLGLCLISTNCQQLHPILRVQLGQVRGHTLYTPSGRPFYAFEGIPYARPPVGRWRFEEPQERIDPWVGVWDATHPGSDCMQYDLYKGEGEDPVVGEEDCLYVNVYTPKLTSNLMDVIAHFHGGAFTCGAGSHDMPTYLMGRDIVFVSVNYRLGPLGFLSTEDHVVPGNNGLKDQVIALQWIQKNIAAFGGNADSVTISGVSAGGASVHFHNMSPRSLGLFNKGISTSGSALCSWTLTEDAATKARTLASDLGCPTTSNVDMVNCLRGRPAKRIVQMVSSPHFMPWHLNPFTPFGPVVEKGGPLPFLSERPWDILRSGKLQALPWLFSVTSEEGLYPVAKYATNATLLEEIERDWLKIAPELLDYTYTVDVQHKDDTSLKVKEYYMKGQPISRATTAPFIQMVGDRLFVVDVERAARLQAAAVKAPVYFYRFSYRGQRSLSEFLSHGSAEDLGVCHADDASYILKISLFKDIETDEDRKMRKLMVDMWVQFAKTGVPVFDGADWATVSPAAGMSGDMSYLHVTSPHKAQTESSPDLANRAFWDSLPIAELANLQPDLYRHTEL